MVRRIVRWNRPSAAATPALPNLARSLARRVPRVPLWRFLSGGAGRMPSVVWARASLLTVLSAHAGGTLAWTPSWTTALTADGTVCPEDCNAHGSCRENKCFCLAGWLGETCNQRDCSPCIHGKCVDGECRCDEGFTGSACQWAACTNNCSGHGACVEGRCLCADGWTGPSCQVRSRWSVASCPNDCSGHGDCFSGRCQCHTTWSGEDCSVAAGGTGGLAALEAPCSSPYATGVGALPCGFNGRCKGVACECFAGWRGVRCEVGICPRDCSGRGACVGGVCACRDGWRGEDCNTPPACPRGLGGAACSRHGLCTRGQCACLCVLGCLVVRVCG